MASAACKPTIRTVPGRPRHSLQARRSQLPLAGAVSLPPGAVARLRGPPTEAALLRFRGESTHESVAVPKLNVAAINELFGRLNGGGIVKVIVQKFGSNDIERRVDTDDVGAIVRHGAAPFD